MDKKLLPNPEETPTITVGQAGELLGICRQSAYRAARRGEIPTIKVGSRVLVPTAGFLKMLEVSA